MASRLLLTMLALLAGLAAQLAPAQARERASGPSEIGAVAAIPGKASVARAATAHGPRLAAHHWRPRERAVPVPRAVAVHAPTVRPGVDRAHE